MIDESEAFADAEAAARKSIEIAADAEASHLKRFPGTLAQREIATYGIKRAVATELSQKLRDVTYELEQAYETITELPDRYVEGVSDDVLKKIARFLLTELDQDVPEGL
jgi:uncharacterized membrane protein YheB (UPF0754 family)